MISIKEFNNLVNIIREYDDIVSKSYDVLGVDMIESKQTLLFNKLVDVICKENLTDDGYDLLNWWLYDDVDKKIYAAKSEEVIADLKTSDDLYNYMVGEFDVYCKK